MTNEEKIKKVIYLAIRNGYSPQAIASYKDYDHEISDIKVYIYRPNNVAVEFITLGRGGWIEGLESIIFNHDFAKAFFGHEPYYTATFKDQHHKGKKLSQLIAGGYWEYALMRLAWTKDKIGFLAEHLDVSHNDSKTT